jgi:hypothetical protein
MKSTPPREQPAEQSSVSSFPINEHDDLEGESASNVTSSSSSSSSSEEDEDGEEDEEIVTLGGPKKPRINPGVLSNAQDLQARLKSFLPQLQQANNELAAKGAGLSMEDVEDDEEHIEMNLGLGVLESKKAAAESGEVVMPRQGQAEQDESSEEEAGQELDPIMLHLLGTKQNLGKKTVEVINDGQRSDSGAASSKAKAREDSADLPLRQNAASNDS